MLETSMAGRTPADFGITLPTRAEQPEEIDLRERGVTVELWMLAAVLGSLLAVGGAFAKTPPPAPHGLTGTASMTPIAPVASVEAPAILQADFAPQVIAAKPKGRLKISAPEGAVVWLDGRRLGRAPLSMRTVVAGEHQVRIQHGGIQFSDVATVPAGETVTYEIAFTLSGDH